MRRLAAATILAVLCAACGSDSGGVDQTVDLFLDKVEATCGAASTTIDRLTPSSDDTSVSDLVGLLTDVHDKLDSMDPPTQVAGDYGDFTKGIDDLVTELKTLARAIRDGDSDAIDSSVGEVNALRDDADRAANNLLITKCKGLTPIDGLVIVGDIPPSTDIPTTEPPSITIPADTSIPTSTPTSTSEEIFPDDLSLGGTAPVPDGYRWIDMEPVDVSGLYEKNIVGPLVEYYAGGRIESIADGHTASIYVLSISQEWTDDAIAEYEFWEGVDGGDETTTPSGIPVRQKLDAFPDTDCLVFTADTTAITVCTFSGIDGRPILDAWVDANSGG